MPSIAAAAIGAAGAIGGSLISANAASKASSQQAASSNNAITAQKGFFNTANQALTPYYTGPQQAEGTLNSLLTPGSGSAQALSQMPGFQFQSQWGTKSTENALAAEGLGGSAGPLSSAISQYNQGLAGTYYTNTTGALQNEINSGVAAGGALAGNATATGQGIANSTQAVGNAQAAGTLGSANALASGLTSAGSSGSNALILSALMNGSGGGAGGGYNPAGGLYGVSTMQNNYGNYG